MSACIITKPITNIIYLTIQAGTYPEVLKTATVSPIFIKEDPLSKENYRPVSVLTVLSKIFERYYQNQLLPHFNRIMSDKLSAYRKNYSTQHVLLRLIENWRRCLDEKKVIDAVLMDLSKAFDCLSHELLIAKLDAYGFNENPIRLVYSNLTNRKQSVKIKGLLSALKRIVSGVPQGFIRGPILFNIFINDLFYFVGEDNLHNFADDNTVSGNALSLNELIQELQTLTESTISWFDQNHMIVNPSKFHAIIIRKDRKNTEGIEININGNVLKSESEVPLLIGITLDNRLTFDIHIGNICKKATNQLDALKRLAYCLNYMQRKILNQSFITSNFNYCPVVWHFCSAKNLHKMKRIQKRALRFIYSDHSSSYNELLEKYGAGTFELNRLRVMCTEIYKILNGIAPSYMQSLFVLNQSRYSSRRPLDLHLPRVNQTTYGLNSFRYEGAKLWNSLPDDIKSSENLITFKPLIKI